MSVFHFSSSDGQPIPSHRHLFRSVQIEGISLFPDQEHLRLHCRIQLGKRVVNAGLQADYSILNRWLTRLPNIARLVIAEAIAEALITGGCRWNFIDLRTRLDERCTIRRCLIELRHEDNENPSSSALKIKAISV